MTMNDQFQRTRMLIGDTAVERLRSSRVLIFGLGGVGSYVCEALARAGIGMMEIVDKDTVDITNINRQLIALHSTVGMTKAAATEKRLKDINPDMKIIARECFYLPENGDLFSFGSYDYVIDAVDNVTAKTDIIVRAKEAGVPVISSMGTGNKLNPSAFKVCDIEKTRVCPLAKVMRKELRRRGVKGVKVVYSEEEPALNSSRALASISFVPAAAGLLIAKTVIDDLIRTD